MPCIQYLVDHSFLPSNSFLDVMQFGTETFHAKEYVTFSARDVRMNVTKIGETKESAGMRELRSRGWIIFAGLVMLLVGLL